MSRKTYRRGFPVAVLVSLEKDHAVIWQVFSNVAKQQQKIPLVGSRNDSKATYSFHENIVNAMRATFGEGVKSVVIAAPPRTSYAQDFLIHIKSHYNWLVSGAGKAIFSTITGSASTPQQVAALAKTAEFKELIGATTAKETENLLELLEKRLNENANLVLFSLQEAESLILFNRADGKLIPEYLLLTDEYLTISRQKNRVQRLIQIAKNRGVKTRVISADSTAGKRVTQLSGIVCLAKTA